MWADAAQLLYLSTQSPHHKVTAVGASHLTPPIGHSPSHLIPSLSLEGPFCFYDSKPELP